MKKLTKLSKDIKIYLSIIEKRFSKISQVLKIPKYFQNIKINKEISNKYQSPSKLRKYNKEKRINEAYDNSIRNKVYNKLNEYKMPLEDEDFRNGEEIKTFEFSWIKKDIRKDKDDDNQIAEFLKAEKDIILYYNSIISKTYRDIFYKQTSHICYILLLILGRPPWIIQYLFSPLLFSGTKLNKLLTNRLRTLHVLLIRGLILFCIFGTINCIKYKNPIINSSVPDPSIIKGDNDYYYLFATGESIYRSLDLINWDNIGKVFEGKSRPSFAENKPYWAPCITKQDDLYILYFTLDVLGIGVATSSSPEIPFDIANGDGKLFLSEELGVEKSVDPFFMEEDGSKFLIFSNITSIIGIELTPNGTNIKNRETFQLSLSGAGVAPYIYKRGVYYYLFITIGNSDDYNEGKNAKIFFGRANNFRGPYFNKDGGRIDEETYEIFLSSNDVFEGPGSNCEIIEDRNGRTWIGYHSYIHEAPEIGRTFCIDEIKWTNNNWPYVTGESPSFEEQESPRIYCYLSCENCEIEGNITEHNC